jgi:hypothetical protein
MAGLTIGLTVVDQLGDWNIVILCLEREGRFVGKELMFETPVVEKFVRVERF